MSQPKLCKDCMHYRRNDGWEAAYDKCAQGAVADLVRGGDPVISKFCVTQRQSSLSESCGPEAKLFEAKRITP